MPRGKGQSGVKISKTNLNVDTEGVGEMFQSIIGTTDGKNVQLHMAHPKFLIEKYEINRFVQTLKITLEMNFMKRQSTVVRNKFLDFYTHMKQLYIDIFENESMTCIHQYMSPIAVASAATQFKHYEPKIDDYKDRSGAEEKEIPKEIIQNFSEVYTQIKDHELMILILSVNEILSKKITFIGDIDKLDGTFLSSGAQSGFNPFTEYDEYLIDFQQIYIGDNMDEKDQEDLLAVLNKLLILSDNVYKASNKSDIDVGKFVNLVRDNIGLIRKKLPGCNQAFDKIVESLGMLNTNFDGYYKNFTMTGNSNVIMESFIMDVSQKTEGSTKIAFQFRKIISYYRKLSQDAAMHGGKKNQQIANLMNIIDKKAQSVQNMSGAAEEDSDEDAPVLVSTKNEVDPVIVTKKEIDENTASVDVECTDIVPVELCDEPQIEQVE